jgi:alkylation response protein AidB-like acyl-CoA dehydrogenase
VTALSAEVKGAAMEDVEGFRQRARTWIRANLNPAAPGSGPTLAPTTLTEEEELAEITHERKLQRMFFDAGFAGICVPPQYGGQGLSPLHQRAFNEELTGFEYPSHLQAPTMSPCMAVLLDFGTEEQKLQHIPAILKGEEIWMQFLSEPSGGSDVAGALTSATKQGDGWIVNGSKVWTTGAWWSDWALCLTRTNWDVPKHRGLTVFIFPMRQAGIEVNRIEMLNGCLEFCQEYMTDVFVPDTDRVGEVDGGWTVGTRWMFHERMLYNSAYVTVPPGQSHGGAKVETLLDIARSAGRLGDPTVRDLLGEARTLELAQTALQRRVGQGVATGTLSDQSAAIARLLGGVNAARMGTIGLEIAGSTGGTWLDEDGASGDSGLSFLMRQTGSIGGGTTEMARNVISERVLKMPRERADDRDVPFREVPRGSAARR